MNATSSNAGADDGAYRYPIESVENAAKTLLMLRTRSSLRTVDVAAELGTARSTAHRMVSTLVQTGLLRRNDPEKSFGPGPALVGLAKVLTSSGDLRAEIESLLSRLVDQAGETAHFLTLQGEEVLFVACVESERVIRAVSRVGHRLPAHVTSAGKCLLSAFSTEELEQLFPPDRSWTDGTEAAIHDREHLVAELAQIAARGWALNNEESEPGLMGVSMPVHGRNGNVLGAVTVSGPVERMRSKIPATVEILKTLVGDFELMQQ